MHSTSNPVRRVVITGLGVVSPIGANCEEFWQALVTGRCGIQNASAVGAAGFAAEAADFRGHIDEFGELPKDARKALRKSLKVMNRQTQMGLAAAQQAIGDSNLPAANHDPERVGVCFGAGNPPMMPEDFARGIRACTNADSHFEFSRWGQEGLPEVAPLWLLTCLPNMPACHIAICNDFQGPNNSITQREASANMALAEAWKTIAEGDAEAMISGATGSTLLPMSLVHTVMERNTTEATISAEQVCRPFDRDRSGSIVAEGAGAFVLESLESALARGATIYAEVVGAGASCVVDRSFQPHRDQAIANAMRAALEEAELAPDGVGHIHAHGMSDPQTDIDESRAIAAVFGDPTLTVPLVAAKGHLGNAEAGAGAIELVASILALQQERLFPVLNYQTPDPDCPVNAVTAQDVQPGDNFMNVSVTPQGQASCLIVSKPHCD